MAIININSSYDEIKKYLDDTNRSTLDKKIAENNQSYALQNQTVTDSYNKQIKDTESGYEDAYTRNAVQKLINERYLAQRMANMGLTDSGLNRTQQTAVQLSYANNRADIDKQKRSAVDSLTSAMTAKLNEIEVSRIASERSIKDSYESSIASQAQDIYKENQSELTSRYKEAVKAAQKASSSSELLLYNVSGYDSSKEKMSYTGSDGKTYYVTAGTNPYLRVQNAQVSVNGETGKVKVNAEWSKKIKNSKTATDIQKSCATYGVFNNGYQPKGIILDGVDYGQVHSSGYTDVVNGKTQTVWITSNGSQWIWDGTANSYRPYQ